MFTIESQPISIDVVSPSAPLVTEVSSSCCDARADGDKVLMKLVLVCFGDVVCELADGIEAACREPLGIPPAPLRSPLNVVGELAGLKVHTTMNPNKFEEASLENFKIGCESNHRVSMFQNNGSSAHSYNFVNNYCMVNLDHCKPIYKHLFGSYKD